MPSSGVPSGHETHAYLTSDDDRVGSQMTKETKGFGSVYDRYLKNVCTSRRLRSLILQLQNVHECVKKHNVYFL